MPGGMGYGFVVVVPDEAVDGLTIEETRLIVNTKEETTEEEFDKRTNKLYCSRHMQRDYRW